MQKKHVLFASALGVSFLNTVLAPAYGADTPTSQSQSQSQSQSPADQPQPQPHAPSSQTVAGKAGQAAATPAQTRAQAQAAHAQAQTGQQPASYFAGGTPPDPTQYLPPPPKPGSLRHQTDDTAFATTRGWKNDARWALAASDARLHLPDLLNSFSCAAGFTIDASKTPRLVALLRKMGSTEVPDMWKGKDYWHRARPFVGTDNAICTEEEREEIAKTGSYPSGHTMLGWSLALVLTEILPDRSTAILQRGRVFGESRIVCGVHWESDVQSGYLVGAGEVAAMHGNPAFRADLDAARAELQALRNTAPKPDAKQCEIEHDAAVHSPL
ncbi:acid phosphatase precursor [Acetobacter indonesiensis NRIC 0313]|uniref:acid phosphatase n=1 Tax=Acetobacter indonesiensis TaxID=104101 RepID=A0A6N3T6K3_9PROT|nr:phosphatase PAP2 family protein [Acetobacter indonesiensis]GAN63036.1 acid phosphatase [Acetobacter indonesiensis]GBQ57480.1 acid phosphatase precursor [Acetobacter indonesiensis NRIC 0313]GEN04483.1 hypothetical protein AIN02nite_25080 [Acetobacter indonesiensis]